MKDIDYYINTKRENTSGCATESYVFDEDNVVLVKYDIMRIDFDEAQKRINRLSDEGIKTPKYLALKRDGDFCWVLQEKAPGIIYSNFTRDSNLEKLEYVANIPLEHYVKYLKDVTTLYVDGLGIELRPRNFFYDNSEGFTIIDIGALYESNTTFDNLFDIYELYLHIKSVLLHPTVLEKDYRIKKKLESIQLSKLLQSFKIVLPSFKRYERWILRTFTKDDLDNLEQIGLHVGDLRLTDEEKKVFDESAVYKIEKTKEGIKLGSYNFVNSDILALSIRYYDDFNLYKLNRKDDLNETWVSDSELNNYIKEIYYQKLEQELSKNNQNDYLKEEYIKLTLKRLDPVNIMSMEERERIISELNNKISNMSIVL